MNKRQKKKFKNKLNHKKYHYYTAVKLWEVRHIIFIGKSSHIKVKLKKARKLACY